MSDDRDGRNTEAGRAGAPDPAYQRTAPAGSAAVAGAGFWADTPFEETLSARLAQNWGAVLARGIIAILFGAIALLMPGVTLASLVLLFAVYMLVDGILALVAAIRAATAHQRWGMLVLEGVADLVAAAIAFVWPLATVVAFVYLMAAWAIVSGVLLASAAVRLHPAHGRWLMLLGGIVSTIWGFLLVVWPLVGAVVLTWWMGAYALFFGGALIALAFQLRWRSKHPSAGQHAAAAASSSANR